MQIGLDIAVDALDALQQGAGYCRGGEVAGAHTFQGFVDGELAQAAPIYFV